MDAVLKSKILHFESLVLQQYERQEAFRRTMHTGAVEAPVCVLKIHRNRLLQDALREVILCVLYARLAGVGVMEAPVCVLKIHRIDRLVQDTLLDVLRDVC